ncbi:MAG: MaoC family dehydratase [Hyphomicrobiaceae bacterium]|nr:MaoC family dehydratase [Hyphomicrobiaceae bacterium]
MNEQNERGEVAVALTASRRVAFTRENIAAYASMAGDTNPLHHDADVAAASRFGRIIACAAHSTGVLVSVLADAYSRDGAAVGLGFSYTLRRAVPEGAIVDLEWMVDELTPSDKPRGTRAKLTGRAVDADSGLVYIDATGEMLFLPPAA